MKWKVVSLVFRLTPLLLMPGLLGPGLQAQSNRAVSARNNDNVGGAAQGYRRAPSPAIPEGIQNHSRSRPGQILKPGTPALRRRSRPATSDLQAFGASGTRESHLLHASRV